MHISTKTFKFYLFTNEMKSSTFSSWILNNTQTIIGDEILCKRINMPILIQWILIESVYFFSVVSNAMVFLFYATFIFGASAHLFLKKCIDNAMEFFCSSNDCFSLHCSSAPELCNIAIRKGKNPARDQREVKILKV